MPEKFANVPTKNVVIDCVADKAFYQKIILLLHIFSLCTDQDAKARCNIYRHYLNTFPCLI